MLNMQKPESQDKLTGTNLDLHSMFYTIQGEGPFTGRRSVFVRLAGCNLQCPWCDTEYTQGRVKVNVLDLVSAIGKKIDAEAAPRYEHLVVITGGEPLRQQIGTFVRVLLESGYRVQIESNGVFAPDAELVLALEHDTRAHLIISPKTSRVNPVCDALAMAYKYVLHHDNVNRADGLPMQALGHKASPFVARPTPKFKGDIYVNPEDSKDDETNRANLQAVKESCIKHGYVAGVQLHKLLDIA